MLAATVTALLTLPVVLAAAVAIDLVRLRSRLPLARVWLFTVQYLVNDSVEIAAAPIYWVLAGFGSRLDGPASLARHRRLQRWSIELLADRAEGLLGLVVELDDEVLAALRPGPVVVVSRHASLLDASLPVLACGRAGLPVRGVVLAELLADPGFDLIYGRLGSVFIARDDGPAARKAVDAMARSMVRNDGGDGAVAICPEGQLFSPPARDRALARLAETAPERAERLAGLTSTLPPRPGGLGVLLDALPGADVVVLDHRGLDGLSGLRQLVELAASRRPRTVAVTACRIPRPDVPTRPEARTRWLDELWLELDAGLGRQG